MSERTRRLTTDFGAAEPLVPRHNVDRFECGREQLDRWLRAYAGQGQRRGTARTFVVCRQGESDVVGYYTLVVSRVEQGEATSEVKSGTSKHFPIPVCLIARLAVNGSEQAQAWAAVFSSTLYNAPSAPPARSPCAPSSSTRWTKRPLPSTNVSDSSPQRQIR